MKAILKQPQMKAILKQPQKLDLKRKNKFGFGNHYYKRMLYISLFEKVSSCRPS